MQLLQKLQKKRGQAGGSHVVTLWPHGYSVSVLLGIALVILSLLVHGMYVYLGCTYTWDVRTTDCVNECYVCMYVGMYICTYVPTYVCVCACACVYVCVCVYVCMYV